MSIDPYDHVICIKCYYRDLLVKMLKFAFLGVYGYTPYHRGAWFSHWGRWVWCDVALRCSLSSLLCAVVVDGGVEGRLMGYSPWHIVKYMTTTNDDCQSSFVVWLPCRCGRCGTWIPCQQDQWWVEVTLLTSAHHCIFPFMGAHCRRRSIHLLLFAT